MRGARKATGRERQSGDDGDDGEFLGGGVIGVSADVGEGGDDAQAGGGELGFQVSGAEILQPVVNLPAPFWLENGVAIEADVVVVTEGSQQTEVGLC